MNDETTNKQTHSEQDNGQTTEPPNKERREFILNSTTGIVAGAGLVAACTPFISSMNPSADILSKARTEANLKGVKRGEVKVVPWQGKPVFILRRTQEQISAMQATDGGGKSPENDSKRVINPDWLVVVGICTHLGCVPLRKREGWFCPCHGSAYDNSGRILNGPAPRNLDVPPYQFVNSETLIIIG